MVSPSPIPQQVVIQKVTQKRSQLPRSPTRKNTAALRRRLVPTANVHSSKNLKSRYAMGEYKPSLRSLPVSNTAKFCKSSDRCDFVTGHNQDAQEQFDNMIFTHYGSIC